MQTTSFWETFFTETMIQIKKANKKGEKKIYILPKHPQA